MGIHLQTHIASLQSYTLKYKSINFFSIKAKSELSVGSRILAWQSGSSLESGLGVETRISFEIPSRG